jgi:hypothetical protein
VAFTFALALALVFFASHSAFFFAHGHPALTRELLIFAAYRLFFFLGKLSNSPRHCSRFCANSSSLMLPSMARLSSIDISYISSMDSAVTANGSKVIPNTNKIFLITRICELSSNIAIL